MSKKDDTVHIEFDLKGSKRFFSVPCSIIDNYIKLADAASLKLMLFLLSNEAYDIDPDKTAFQLGITRAAFDDALIFWKQQGYIKDDSDLSEPEAKKSPAISDPPRVEDKKPVSTRISYTPKDIASMIDTDESMRELFSEAEATLGRLLKHSDHEMLINLKDYYCFPVQSIILILEYCRDLEKTSVRYIETVADDLFRNGITEFLDIDEEIKRRKDTLGFEGKIKHCFGIDTKLTQKQSQYISSWRDLGFDIDMISAARERCVDATNKLSFAYIDKILRSWADKNIFKTEDIDKEKKPQEFDNSKEHSFDLDEFDKFTLGINN